MRPAQKRVQKYGARKRKVSPEEFIHNQLIQFEKYDRKHHEFWAEYLGSLAFEREKRLEDIKSALWDARLQGFQMPAASRIVGGNYARNPLCTIGSTIEGGRFNFGGQASYMGAFHCLYIADSFDTAFAEKFFLGKDERTPKGDLSALDLQVKRLGSFAHLQLGVSLETYIDVREIERLRPFCEIIASIKVAPHFYKRAKGLRINLSSIKSLDQLRSGLLEEKYKQWGVWVDHPSPSQWFGHYARAAGIGGIVYPSVRSGAGVNVALFPDNLKDTASYVEISDEQEIVPSNRCRMDGTNYLTYFQDEPDSGLLH